MPLYSRSAQQGQELLSKLPSVKRAAMRSFSKDDIHLGVKEDLKDTARVLGRMFDAIAFRASSKRLLKFWRSGLAFQSITGLPTYTIQPKFLRIS